MCYFFLDFLCLLAVQNISYLKRVKIYAFGNYAVYDAPNGKKLFEITDNNEPYWAIEVLGDWIKVGRNRLSENAEGWIKWKDDKKSLIGIVETRYYE